MKDLESKHVSFSEFETNHGNFSNVVTCLWRVLFKRYAMSHGVPEFQIGKDTH